VTTPTVTCRVCADTYAAFADAILICPMCRRDGAATRALIARSVDAAHAVVTTMMQRLTLDEMRTYYTVLRQSDAAERQGGSLRFQYERQLAELSKQGGTLARMVAVRETAQRTQTWAAEALRELDELAELEREAA
jgi:hypothetical protein